MAKSYKYRNENGRTVSGTAALLHVVKEDGGLAPHYAKIYVEMAEAAIADRNLEMANPIVKAIREGRTA